MCGERDIEEWGVSMGLGVPQGWKWGHHKGWGQGCVGAGGTAGMEVVAPRCWRWKLGDVERLGSQQGWSQRQHGTGVSQAPDNHGMVDVSSEYQDSGALRTR